METTLNAHVWSVALLYVGTLVTDESLKSRELFIYMAEHTDLFL